MDSGGTGSMCWSRRAAVAAAARAAPSQWSRRPCRSSWDSSWRNAARSASHSSGQNCRTGEASAPHGLQGLSIQHSDAGTTGPSREASRSSGDHRTQQGGLQELRGPQDPAGRPPDLDQMELDGELSEPPAVSMESDEL
ncbi:hypothetical protein EYF80_056292 [Liparis tanakae]|uniref:Uncharacterized protein n=1 Tax=Liparis tanakae TaxID=230148 RepID=A0A4Z2EXK5_9TELE|nr:hypothetical protein EYF80_056292 [Liparis tanakae]